MDWIWLWLSIKHKWYEFNQSWSPFLSFGCRHSMPRMAGSSPWRLWSFSVDLYLFRVFLLQANPSDLHTRYFKWGKGKEYIPTLQGPFLLFHLIFCLNFIGQSIRKFCLSVGETQVCACILSLLRKRDNRDLEEKKQSLPSWVWVAYPPTE